jgi:NADPH-dependent 2,4-dienoyl-CoA reductase/sulfur reductase-like enzyme
MGIALVCGMLSQGAIDPAHGLRIAVTLLILLLVRCSWAVAGICGAEGSQDRTEIERRGLRRCACNFSAPNQGGALKIAVIGTGYVGLVTGTCLAESGNDVTCLDVDPGKIATLREGGIPIYEPGLEELVKRNAREKRLAFTTSVEEAMEGTGVAFIAVGTPPGETGDADLS